MVDVTVEEVTGGKALIRFTELPQVLHGPDPRWAPLVLAWERYRLDPRRNPFFEAGDGRYFLARRAGRPVGRITAHLAGPDEAGRFGFWCVEDDRAAAEVLLDAAQKWLSEQGCTSMVGPWSFEPDDEPGALYAGFEVPGVTGRPWRPPWEARLLEGLGGTAVAETRSWRLPATVTGPERDLTDDAPGQAGACVDRRLVLDGIAAVPDLADALRGTRLRTAWSLATRARRADWDVCTVVRCTADPAVAVPALQRAAGRAGYREVIAPWSPEPDAPPETIHRTYRFGW